MMFFSKPDRVRMPSETEALPGRTQAMAVAPAHAVNGNPLKGPWPDGVDTAVFGMGCFWGAERLFWQVDGVFSYNNSADPGNIRNRPETGGGSLPDIGVYTMGSARFLTEEEPQEILEANITWQNDVDVWAAISAKFPSFHFNATTSMRMSPRQEMNFHGTDGFIRLTAPFNPLMFSQAEVQLHTKDMLISKKRFPSENHYVFQLEAFRASAYENAPYACPLEFSQGTQRMIDLVLEKAQGS